MNYHDPEDVQAAIFYNWERALWDQKEKEMPLVACEKLISDAWRAYRKRKPPTITNGRGYTKTACYDPVKHQIKLPKWARKAPIVLHEVAHAIDDRINGTESSEIHGADFARIMIELYSWYAGYPRRFLIKSARAYGIRVSQSRKYMLRPKAPPVSEKECAERMIKAIRHARKDFRKDFRKHWKKVVENQRKWRAAMRDSTEWACKTMRDMKQAEAWLRNLKCNKTSGSRRNSKSSGHR